MAQRDPLIEYQREGFDLFTAMMDGIKEETVGYLFNLEVQVEQPIAAKVGVVGDGTLAGSAEAAAEPAAVAAEEPVAEPAAATGPRLVAPGLAPTRPRQLEYSAPTEDGGVAHGQMAADDEGIVEVDPNASRAERRRAERANRKRRG
jgi:preprotein translocase subunit SecA